MNHVRRCALTGWNQLERVFDKAFGGALNPLRHLGALAVLFFCLLAISGVYLYAALDTSAQGAYRSIDQLARDQWWLGGVLRSIHRYAADAFVVVIVAHLVREWILGRYTGFRRYSWLTGVPLLILAQISGVGGFWLNWDRLGQFSAIATAEWLDWLPIFAAPFTRNFLSAGSVTDRLFSLFVFVHLGVSLLLLLGLWFHVQRLARPGVFPPRALVGGASATLILLAVVVPVMSQSTADLASAPSEIALDWPLLFVHALMYATSAGFVWALLAGVLLFLLALPFVTRGATLPTARVDPDNCSGCGFCFDDCPYAAITMQPHPDGTPGKQLARVQPELCASCGICTGACPSSTPFRSVAELEPGIDMPQAPIGDLRERLQLALATLRGERRVVVFGCDHGARVSALADSEVIAFSLYCAGMLPPSFIEYALRNGATTVVITGCSGNGCEFRLGQRWTEERLQGARAPHLRASVSRDRVRIVWAGRGEEARLRAQLRTDS